MYYPRRRRRIRPSSHFALVAIAWILSALIWIGWELGRMLSSLTWWRSVVVLTSGITFVLFAVGDYLY